MRRLVATLIQDLRYGLRRLAGNPGFMANKKRNKTSLSQDAPLFPPMRPSGTIQPADS